MTLAHVVQITVRIPASVLTDEFFCQTTEESLTVTGPFLILLDVLGDDASHVPVKPHKRQVGRGNGVLTGCVDERLDLWQDARKAGFCVCIFAVQSREIVRFRQDSPRDRTATGPRSQRP